VYDSPDSAEMIIAFEFPISLPEVILHSARERFPFEFLERARD